MYRSLTWQLLFLGSRPVEKLGWVSSLTATAGLGMWMPRAAAAWVMRKLDNVVFCSWVMGLLGALMHEMQQQRSTELSRVCHRHCFENDLIM